MVPTQFWSALRPAHDTSSSVIPRIPWAAGGAGWHEHWAPPNIQWSREPCHDTDWTFERETWRAIQTPRRRGEEDANGRFLRPWINQGWAAPSVNQRAGRTHLNLALGQRRVRRLRTTATLLEEEEEEEEYYILYYIMLCYIILYYIILCYVILYYIRAHGPLRGGI